MKSGEYEALLNDMDKRLDRLRALYEQWFQGIERIEPMVVRKDFDRRLVMLRKLQPRNTAMRFRFQQIIQRYTSYVSYWRRIARKIEEGTFRRDVVRARTTVVERRVPSVPPPRAEPHDEADPQSPPSVRGDAPKVPPPIPPARHAASKVSPPVLSRRNEGMTEAEIKQIYQRYVAARRENNERVDNVRYDKIAQSIRNMVPKLQEKHKGPVQFEVVIKDGRVGLKAVGR